MGVNAGGLEEFQSNHRTSQRTIQIWVTPPQGVGIPSNMVKINPPDVNVPHTCAAKEPRETS